MDQRLLAWGHAATRRLGPAAPPVLWLFTDMARLPDPRAAASRLPSRIAGVVFRHDGHPNRAALGRELALICRARRLTLVVAGDVRLAAALRAGVHLRGGRWPGPVRRSAIAPSSLVTSSAHSAEELRRAMRGGATLVFLSPAFPTLSHLEAPSLGAARWAALARQVRIPVAALGGIDGGSIRRLPWRRCRAVGAIGALA